MRHTEAALVDALGMARRERLELEAQARQIQQNHEAAEELLEAAARRTGELVLERDKLTADVARLRGEAARLAVDLERCTKERDEARADARRLAGVTAAPAAPIAAPTT